MTIWLCSKWKDTEVWHEISLIKNNGIAETPALPDQIKNKKLAIINHWQIAALLIY